MKKKKRKNNPKKKVKITPAVIVGVIFGLLIIITGLYISIVREEYTGYPTIGLGLCLIILIIIVARGKTR